MLNHYKHPHRTFIYVWIVGAVVVLIAGMVVYALQHPRAMQGSTFVEDATVPVVGETR